MQYFGILSGVGLLYIFFYAYKLLIKFVFNLDYLTGLDIPFIADKEKDRFNLIGLSTFDKFDSEKIKNVIIENGLKKLKKLRVKMVYKFFNFYWQEVSLDEAIKRIKIHPGLRDEGELYAYIETEINTYIDVFREQPYEIHIIPYGNDQKGAMLFKYDHLMSDGLGLISLLCGLATNYSVDIFPSLMKNIKEDHFMYKLLDYFTFFYYGPFALVQMALIFLRSKDSPFKNKSDISGKTRFAISKTYDLKSFDKIRKHLKLTFNDLMMSIVAISVKRMINDKYPTYQHLKQIRCFVPIGKKTVPQSASQVQLTNKANGVFADISLINDINEATQISKDLKKILSGRGLLEAYHKSVYLAGEFFPYSLMGFFTGLYTSKFDIVVSNVPGPVSQLYYGDCVCNMVMPIASAGRAISFLPLISYNNKFRFVFSVDQRSQVHPSLLVNGINDVIEEILAFKIE